MKPANATWRTYFRNGLGRRLSMLGERLHVDWLVYNRLHFEHFHDNAIANAPGVIRVLLRYFPDAQRWIDVGAGTGVFAAELQRQGKSVIACEHNPYGRRRAAEQGVNAILFDLMQDVPAQTPGPFDVAYCFEVAEHLPPELGDRLVAFLAQLASTVIFTAAHPGQMGTGHINEQPREYWISKFEEHGMTSSPGIAQRLHDGFVAEKVPGAWFRENIIVCQRL